MKNDFIIFISWSGENSHYIAKLLYNWLPLFIDGPKYWLASVDIPDGIRWNEDLSKNLENSNFGIIIVTPDNLNSPWQMFEAGALSKNLVKGKVIPYLIQLERNQLHGPLSQFQALTTNQKDTFRLITTINDYQLNPIDKSILKKRFMKLWLKFQDELNTLTSKIFIKKRNITKKDNNIHIIKQLKNDLKETKEMIKTLVTYWQLHIKNNSHVRFSSKSLSKLDGSWVGDDGTHMYLKTIKGKIYSPYCYAGNSSLTGEYYCWERINNNYWFTKFRSLIDLPAIGFSFFKIITNEKMLNWWWMDLEGYQLHLQKQIPSKKILSSGRLVKYVKNNSIKTPIWAKKFFEGIK